MKQIRKMERLLLVTLVIEILSLTRADLSSLPNVTITQLNAVDDDGEGASGSNENFVDGTVISKPYNSDVIVGEDTDKTRSLLLSCMASYPVQWIYTGDGRPELSTNTSVRFLRLGKKDTSPISFTAFATITNPQEKNTGNYTCRSLQDPKVAVYYFIYVPGSTLFTSPGGYQVFFSRRDPTVRIPCSISNPKALVGLQKSVNGLLNCPLNDSISYDPKTGFHLKTHDFANAQGKYICSAAYNNTVRYIEFDLVSTDPSTPPSSSNSHAPSVVEPEKGTDYCSRNIDCPDSHVCIDDRCSSECASFCASNAHCRIINHIPECTCPNFHTGDPYVQCRPRESEHQNQTHADPCVPSPCGEYGECKMVGKILTCTCKSGYFGTPPNCRVRQCVESKECPSNQACILGVCSDPCITGVCGKNSKCRVVNRSPVCSCMTGFEGDPFDECKIKRHPVKIENSTMKNYGSSQQSTTPSFHMSCSSLSCGRNAQCSLLGDGRPICRCEIGFNYGDPYSACYSQNELASKVNPCLSSPCGPNTICSRNVSGSALCTCMPDTEGNPYVGCKPRACVVHDDCLKNQTCVGHRCHDGCLNRNTCGVNARCSTEQHVTRCHCLAEYTGNPERECYKMLTRPSLPPVTPLPVQQTQVTQEDNPCHPSPCAKSAVCSIFRGRALCRCPPPLQGDPVLSCEQRCKKTSECPSHQVCYVVNSTCVDVCSLYDVGCGSESICRATNHMPACYRKPENLQTDGESGICTVDSDCPSTKKCFLPNGRCLDPCKFRGVCGVGEDCQVINHRPSCVYKENPLQQQGPTATTSPSHQQQQQQSCEACGPYSDCQISRGIIVCSCKPNMSPNHRPPFCRPECQYDSQCGFNMACIAFKCQDPCIGACGTNALCHVRRHKPNCMCQPGHLGDPYVACRPECTTNTDCPQDKACVSNKCTDPCPGSCGLYAICRVQRNSPVCSCPKGYYGNPLYRCTCCNNQRTDLHNSAANHNNDDDEYDDDSYDSTLTPIHHFIKRISPNQTVVDMHL